MTKIEIVREDEKATAILKAIRQIDDGAELEPVIRCKDCFYWKRHTRVNKFYGKCSRLNTTKHENGYCEKGERKDNG